MDHPSVSPDVPWTPTTIDAFDRNRNSLVTRAEVVETLYLKDADGDGVLTLEELPEELAPYFVPGDADGDMRLTREELVASLADLGFSSEATEAPIRVGISSCLLGAEVRFDGGHKRDAYINGTLSAYFEFVPGVPNLTGLGRTAAVLEIWQSEFEYLADKVGTGCMVVTMHPQSTGRGSRISLLSGFIEFVLDHGGAEFLRADVIAQRFRADQVG